MNGNILPTKLLLKRIEKENVVCGIIIPNINEVQKESEVVLVGKDVEQVKVGDVVYHNNPGLRVSVDSCDYYLINESDVLYIL